MSRPEYHELIVVAAVDDRELIDLLSDTGAIVPVDMWLLATPTSDDHVARW